MDVNKIYELLETDLRLVKEKISEILNNSSTKESKPVIDYLLQTQGKLIRPILVFLSAYALDEDIAYEKKEKTYSYCSSYRTYSHGFFGS